MAGLTWAGHGLLFSTFMLYDDEGYVLMSLRSFAVHGALYDLVFSQYGPFFYLLNDALRATVGFTWDNTSGRLVTLAYWLIGSGACTLLVIRATRSWAAATYTFAATFTFLWTLIKEPMHPGGMITALVGLAAAFGAEAAHRNRPLRFAFIIGALGAALALVKINVGAFLVIAGACWLSFSLPLALRRPVRLLTWGGAAALPVALMQSLLHQGWVQHYVALISLSAVACLLAVEPAARRETGSWRPVAIFLTAGAGVTLLTVLLTWGRGTSFTGLLEGIVLDPLRHPAVYTFGVRWRPASLALAAGVLALVIFARNHSSHRGRHLVAWLRIGGFLAFQLTLLPGWAISQGAYAISYGVPLAALFAFPLRAPGPSDRARAWVALLLVFQSLHAYPVAGSQLNWGTFLWMPLLVLGLFDALAFLTSDAARCGPQFARRCHIGAAGALFVVAAATSAHVMSIARGRDAYGSELGLIGAEHISLPADTHSALTVLARNARHHGRLLVTLPGMFSFNLWTDVPPPTLRNVTHWFSLLNAAEQQAIIDRLDTEPDSLLIVQHNVLAQLLRDGFRAEGPLMQYLMEHYQRAFAIEGYTLWTKRGRAIAPLATARYLRTTEDAPPHALAVTLPPLSAPIARVELRRLFARDPIAVWDARGAALQRQWLRDDGSTQEPPAPAPWPVAADALQRLVINLPPNAWPPAELGVEVVALDHTGDRLLGARLLPDYAFDAAPPRQP